MNLTFPGGSAGLSPEHHLQSIVWVKQAQLNACEGKDSTQKPTVGGDGETAWPIALLKSNHSWLVVQHIGVFWRAAVAGLPDQKLRKQCAEL